MFDIDYVSRSSIYVHIVSRILMPVDLPHLALHGVVHGLCIEIAFSVIDCSVDSHSSFAIAMSSLRLSAAPYSPNID